MQLLIDAQNDSPEQINLAIIYLQQVLAMRSPETSKDAATPVKKTEPKPLSEIAPDPLAPQTIKPEQISPAPAPKADKPKPAKAAKPEVAKTVTQDEVRQVMIAKQGEGKSGALKALLNDYSATKISEIPLDKLAEFKSKAEAL